MRNTTTRRDFLKSSAGLAAGGLAVPSIWTNRSLHAQEANDRLNVAAIGTGGRGSGIGHQAGGQGNMVACADVQRGNAERFAERYNGRCTIYNDYREMLDKEDIDVIICGTPDHSHTKICVDAMQAGKDVYCEKPLTLTIEESQQICEVVRATGAVFQVGTQQRTENERRFLKAIVMARSGRLGDKLHALSSVGGATSGGPFPTEEPPEELDWDLWLGPAPEVPFSPNRIGWNFRWWFEYSGGQVTDWGVHHTDIALWALGGELTGVVEATPVESNFPLGRELTRDTLLGEKPFQELPVSYNVANRFKVDMTLENDNEITLYSGTNELIISGERGRIRVNRGSLTGRPIEELTEQDKVWLDEEVVKLYGGEPRSHMHNFFACCRSREQPVSDVFSHAHSCNACHIANIAMLLDRPVRFDPGQYDFVDDEQASRLMSREVRDPWKVTL